MNCAFIAIDEYHATGRQMVQCRRCGHKGRMPRSGKPNDHIRPCQGWPLAHEASEWLALFRAALGIDSASAMCRYILWRIRGSKLEDLPPEIPRPSLPTPNAGLSAAEVTELLPDESDPTLIGNRIAALTKAIGIPPCGACGKRQQWMNKAHELLRRKLASAVETTPADSAPPGSGAAPP